MGLTTYPASGGAVWGDIIGTVADQTDLTTAFGTQGIKRYLALLTQSGSSSPTATVLENTLGGTPVWARTSAGIYTLTLSGAFTTSKTQIFVGTEFSAGADFVVVSAVHTSANVVTFFLKDVEMAGPTATASDNNLFNTPIRIYVYP